MISCKGIFIWGNRFGPQGTQLRVIHFVGSAKHPAAFLEQRKQSFQDFHQEYSLQQVLFYCSAHLINAPLKTIHLIPIEPNLAQMDLKQQKHTDQVPPVHDQRFKEVDPHNRHRPGYQDQNVYRNQDPRHTLQPISHQGHEAAHAVSVEIVKLDPWIFLGILSAHE